MVANNGVSEPVVASGGVPDGSVPDGGVDELSVASGTCGAAPPDDGANVNGPG